MTSQTMPHSRVPRWSTSSLGHPADISAREYSALSEHLNLCKSLRSTWLALSGGANSLQALLAARVVTAAVVISLLTLAVWLVP